MACLNPDYCGTGDKETLCDNCLLDMVSSPPSMNSKIDNIGERFLMLDERKAKAIARVVNDQWINRDDMEAMEVVNEICEFANPKAPIKPLEKS